MTTKPTKVMQLNNHTKFTMRNNAVALKFGTQIDKLEKEKAEYYHKVKDFLESCKSCKQVLELLPAAYDWLPDKDAQCSDMPVADLARKVIGL